MSKPLLGYVKRSPLFNPKHIQDQYRRFSDQDLQKELDAYREYCLREISLQASRDKKNLSIFSEGFNSFLPKEALLRQCALYVEEIIINDPIFEIARPSDELAKGLNSYLGMKESGIDRNKLAQLATYVNQVRPAIQANFVKFFPVSHIHEPPKQIPLTYSENLYSDVLPDELLKWFRESAVIYPLRKGEQGWYHTFEIEPLKPCRAICINFEGHSHQPNADRFYFLFATEVLARDEETHTIEFAYTLPETLPSEELFNNWVFQSVNKTALGFSNQVYSEMYLAEQVGATYLTQSPFIAELLRKNWPQEPNFKADILNVLLDLEIPILEGVSLNRIIDVRQKEGEAFQNFRVDLERRLRELRHVSDPVELQAKSQDVVHEFSEVQINEINKAIAKVKKKMAASAIPFVGGLVMTIQANGFGIPALVYAIDKGYKTYAEYISEVKENPAFFLWKVTEKRKLLG